MFMVLGNATPLHSHMLTQAYMLKKCPFKLILQTTSKLTTVLWSVNSTELQDWLLILYGKFLHAHISFNGNR